MENLQVITAKQLSSSMCVDVSTAKRYLKDVKQEYDIKIVLLYHIQQYFKVDLTKEAQKGSKSVKTT